MYNDFINFKTAEILDNVLYGDDEYVYAAEDLETTNDNFIGSQKHKAGELFCKTCEYVHGKSYYAPTYAEVLDYLAEQFDIYVEFTPWHTFALKDHVAYTYRVFIVNEETAKMDMVFKSDEWLASMGLCIQEIVDKLFKGELGVKAHRE